MVNRALGSPVKAVTINTSKTDMQSKLKEAMDCKAKEEEKKEREDNRNRSLEHMAADARKEIQEKIAKHESDCKCKAEREQFKSTCEAEHEQRQKCDKECAKKKKDEKKEEKKQETMCENAVNQQRKECNAEHKAKSAKK